MAASKTLRDFFDDICSCISEQDVVSFAKELLHNGLCIKKQTNVPSSIFSGVLDDRDFIGCDTINQLVSDAISRVSDFRSEFDKFVSILEKRNSDLALNLRSNYLSRRLSALHDHEEQLADHEKPCDFIPPSPKRQKEDDFCAEYVRNLQQAYQALPPHDWKPLPCCQHIKLSMIRRKGKRYGTDEVTAESRVLGEVGKILSTTTVQDVDSDRIFDAGIFDEERQVILVEGVSGMGKTSLAYYYCQNWRCNKLKIFDAVVLVRLRDLHACITDLILPNLLANASRMNLMTKEMAQVIVNNLKILIILDGWDEVPIGPQDLDNLLASVSSQTRILITSRPESSLDLHSRANRVEILGFTTYDIHSYFKKALQYQLESDELESALDTLRGHLRDKPVIESCCYVPLNSAILAYIYIYRKQALPVTRWELFRDLVLCCIERETSTRQSRLDTEGISSFVNLPSDLRCQLDRLSLLAFEGVKQNKIVFTQEDLASHQIFPKLGLLHCVKGFGPVSSTYNFIHLSVQEILAAYHMSKLKPTSKHLEQFELLLNSQKFQVLEFYAGLTKLSNESVQNLIVKTASGCCNDTQIVFKSFLNCIFEAQISDQSFYKQIPVISDFRFVSIFLSPIDCMSINYFLSYIQRTENFSLIFLGCSIDGHSLDLLLGSSASILKSVKKIFVMRNKITDYGVSCIAKSLLSNNRIHLERLLIGDKTVTDIGAHELLSILPHCECLEDIGLEWSCEKPQQILPEIGEQLKCLSKLFLIQLYFFYPNDNEEQQVVIEKWFDSVRAGGKHLIHSLENSNSSPLKLKLSMRCDLETICCPSEIDMAAKVNKSLQKSIASVNEARETDHLYLELFMNNHNSGSFYCDYTGSKSSIHRTSYIN